MHKHRRQDGQRYRDQGRGIEVYKMAEFIRDATQSKEQRLSPSWYKEILIDKDRDIGKDEGHIDKRNSTGWIFIS